MTDLISRQAAIDYVRTEMCSGAWCGVLDALKRVPSAQPEQPSREYVEQLKWERDLAIQQLKDLGYGLGENPRTQPEIVRCFDCKNSPLKTWFNCPLAHLPFDGGRWCWKGERDDSISD